jgi:hypothetical protein
MGGFFYFSSFLKGVSVAWGVFTLICIANPEKSGNNSGLHLVMKTSFVLNAFGVAMLSAALSFSAPVFGEDTDMLNQALDLVHQAWNPGGDPPSDDQRTDLLNQALKLAHDAPEHHVKGHRVQAIRDIKAALSLIKNGDPDHKAVEYIRDADSELRDALSIAE